MAILGFSFVREELGVYLHFEGEGNIIVGEEIEVHIFIGGENRHRY